MNKKGFTLIELLVVIAIIGLLSTLAVVALATARQKARDANRMSDLKQMQTALELYYNDQNSYPTGSGTTLGSTGAVCLNTTGFVASTDCGTSPYMGKVPADPVSSQSYVYTVASSSYSVTATLEGKVNGLENGIKLTPNGIEQN